MVQSETNVHLQAAGYWGVWTAASAWYIAFAELLNETWFRGRVCFHVYPVLSLEVFCSMSIMY